jgi:iron complex transport system substrate-binding protein
MRILLIGSLIFTFSCVQHANTEEQFQLFPDPQIEFEVKYAKGFDIVYNETSTLLISKSIEGNEFFKDTLQLIHENGLNVSAKVLNTYPKSINCQSSTHLAYIDFLNEIDRVSGVCGLGYIHQGELLSRLKNNDVKEVCLGENIQLESVLSTNTDLFMVYPFAKTDAENLDANGVKTFMIAEYLETSPLARLEWIKIYGTLLGKEAEAEIYFNEVEENYSSLVQPSVDTNLSFIFNLPFGDSWFTPSANSLIVRLLEDAGMSYLYSKEKGTENITHPQEEIWNDGTKAAYWIIIADRPADFSLEQLISENPVYATFSSVINQQVIFCNTTSSDYFLKGVLEPHVMLKDLLFALHKMDAHEPKYFHLLK